MPLITYLTKIQFDFGAVSLLTSEMAALGITRPLIVTDKGVIAAGLLDKLKAQLPNPAAAAVFDGTPENPTEAATLAATQQYREHGADGVIGFGGGSSLDLAKGVRLLATHPEPLTQYMAVEGGAARITPKLSPMIAVPTTSGTGSEVGRGAVFVLEDGRKLAALSPHLIPNVALCDPELTLTMPARITAGTGMDAIAHCIETFISPVNNPPAEGIALEGLRRGWAHIERAVTNGQDREARWEMMMASMMGAMAFQKGLGAVHAMSHPLGALKHVNLHHGTLNAVVLPTVLRFNKDHVGDRYERIQQSLRLDPKVSFDQAVAGLNQRLGIPATLRELGVTANDLGALAELAEKDHTNLTNPRPATAADYRALFEEALG